METLYIADDELSIREGLKCILDWKSIGYEICGEARNGEEALHGLITKNPSLVLLDVRMPKMMGTEVLRRARALGFTGKCIILSGYSDFTYAQEAIENGVSYYLTKPLDEDELNSAVNKIMNELTAQKEHSSNIIQIKSKAKEVILKEIVHGISKENYDKYDLDFLHLESECYQIIICEKYKKNVSNTYALTDLFNVFQSTISCFEQFKEDDLEIILLKGSHGCNRLTNLLDHFDEEPEEGSPLSSLFITYGRPVSSIFDIRRSYEEARALIERHFFCPMEQHYMGYEDLPETLFQSNKTPDTKKLMEYASLLNGYIQSFNHQQVADILQSIKDYLTETTNDIPVIKMFLTDLYFQVKENIIRSYPNAQIPFPNTSTVIRFINEANYLYEIIRFLSEQCNLIMSATGNPSRDTILDDILYYIDHNYALNIKLETIAPLFGYNSAYLGKIFHKSVGESFNSYIDHKRIEASVELLENESLKVYEISDMIGYKNVDYFHKKFRKYMGVSPAEYRKNF